jgi:hypothetical protein
MKNNAQLQDFGVERIFVEVGFDNKPVAQDDMRSKAESGQACVVTALRGKK